MKEWLVVAVLALGLAPDAAQSPQAPGRQPELPTRAKLSEVEVSLNYEGGEGCAGRCIAYRVTIRGDGLVEYADLGGEPRDPPRRRSVAIDEVVSLVNEFLRARFVDARSVYDYVPIAERQGDSLQFLAQGASGSRSTLTLRVAAWTKTAQLNFGYPQDYARLLVLVELIGGPSAWKNERATARVSCPQRTCVSVCGGPLPATPMRGSKQQARCRATHSCAAGPRASPSSGPARADEPHAPQQLSGHASPRQR